jgi:hypothetical protein
MYEINRNPTRAELRKFGVVILCGLTVIGALLWWTGRGEGAGWGWNGSRLHWTAAALWFVGAGVFLLTLMSQGPSRVIYVAWMTLAGGIGTVVTFVLLSVLYFVFLPIFSLIRFKDPLRLKMPRTAHSYWEEHKHHESTLERTARPF